MKVIGYRAYTIEDPCCSFLKQTLEYRNIWVSEEYPRNWKLVAGSVNLDYCPYCGTELKFECESRQEKIERSE